MRFTLNSKHSVKLNSWNKRLIMEQEAVYPIQISEENISQFADLKTNLERVNFFYNPNDVLKCEDSVNFQNDEKNDVVAKQKRESGNDYFQSRNYRNALDFYTVSIATAKSAEVLALAYANRSAALSSLKLHRECLVDIERALQNGYPDNLKPKLIKRQNHSTAQTISNEKYYETVPTCPDSEKHSSIEAARNCVKITRNEQYGRCVMATRDIQIGEILSIEKPYAAIITDEIYVHCHECFELCYNLIPCNSCTKALYCGKSCKDRAFDTYHKYECSILLTLDSFDSLRLSPHKRLALKMVFIAKNELNSDTSENEEVYRSHRLKEILNMEGHVENLPKSELLGKSVYTARLFHLIKEYTKFLGDGIDEDRLKEVLLLMILICSLNAVDIYELIPEGTGYRTSATALGIYSFFTLFNHSCWPNVMCQYYGSTKVLRAINTIKEEEQCFVTYGPTYLGDSTESRKKRLDGYFFTCTCRACKENWPTGHNIKTKSVGSSFLKKFLNADVSAAKGQLPLLLEEAKRAEVSHRPGQDSCIKEVLVYCYNVFGNKRRI